MKNEPDINIALTAHWQGKMVPVVYTKSYGDGRVGYIALGHGLKAFTNSSFQELVSKGLEWVLGKEIEKKVINCGIIGYGAAFNMGKYHLDMINATPGLKGVAVCDNDSSRLEVAKKKNIMLSIFHNRRYDGSFLAIKEAVDKGLILGEIDSIVGFTQNRYCQL